MAKQAIEPGFCQCGCGGKTTIATQNDAHRGLLKGQPARFLHNHNARRSFLPFKEAREFVRGLGLKSHPEWRAYSRSGNRPDNIPAKPQTVYASEFSGWADWLGYLGVRGRWTTTAIGTYLKSIAPEIPSMRDASLVALITEAGLGLPLRQLLGRVSM